MKVKLQQVLGSANAIAQLAQKELPAKAAYRVSKLVKRIQAESRDLQEQRAKMIEKYGAKVKRQGPGGKDQEVTEVTPENIETYTAEMKALLEEEVELEGLAPVKFADIERLNLSPAVLADLDFMIEAPAEETT